jgi:predicted Rossmann-fold nucleotide-binding protein
MKRLLLADQVQRCLHGIYFLYPSLHHQEFFSPEDRALLNDLNVFGIPVFWVDRITKKILRYLQKPGTDAGMFVPNDKVDTYLKSTVFGIYGSNLTEGNFEDEIHALLQGVLEMRKDFKHPYLNPTKPLSLLTGGGPGVMELGNRVALELGILSCANIVDFRLNDDAVVNEQHQNPYIQAKMTYRLNKLVERQAEFNLDFPIFLIGGIGTDFEFTLEEVRRKVGSTSATPCLLFGSVEYWEQKISSRFRCNIQAGTIKGSEWLSNCFYCVQNATQGLQVYKDYFNGKLLVGKNGPVYDRGFALVTEQGYE